MFSTPPIPVLATVSKASQVFTITFDQPLTPATLSTAPWLAVAVLVTLERTWAPVSGPIASGSAVTWTGFTTGPGVFGPVVHYTPPPADLFGANGLPAAAFSGFPLTVLP